MGSPVARIAPPPFRHCRCPGRAKRNLQHQPCVADWADKTHSSAMMEISGDDERRLLLEEGRILLDHRTHPVNECRHQARLMHCGNCQRYRHVARSCRARQATCRLCAQKHRTEDHTSCTLCPEASSLGCVHDQRLCANCAGPHAAGDDLCSSHINETTAVQALNQRP
jgi:hypothetical protein